MKKVCFFGPASVNLVLLKILPAGPNVQYDTDQFDDHCACNLPENSRSLFQNWDKMFGEVVRWANIPQRYRISQDFVLHP